MSCSESETKRKIEQERPVKNVCDSKSLKSSWSTPNKAMLDLLDLLELLELLDLLEEALGTW